MGPRPEVDRPPRLCRPPGALENRASATDHPQDGRNPRREGLPSFKYIPVINNSSSSFETPVISQGLIYTNVLREVMALKVLMNFGRVSIETSFFTKSGESKAQL